VMRARVAWDLAVLDGVGLGGFDVHCSRAR
jgi:hypothetical protein